MLEGASITGLTTEDAASLRVTMVICAVAALRVIPGWVVLMEVTKVELHRVAAVIEAAEGRCRVVRCRAVRCQAVRCKAVQCKEAKCSPAKCSPAKCSLAKCSLVTCKGETMA